MSAAGIPENLLKNSPPYPERYTDRPRRHRTCMKSVASDRITDASSRVWSKTRRRWVEPSARIYRPNGDHLRRMRRPRAYRPSSATRHSLNSRHSTSALCRSPSTTIRWEPTGGGWTTWPGSWPSKEGCLLVEVPSNPDNAPWPARLAIWPSSFSLDVESGTVRVFDGQGQVAAQVGDYVRISRAELTVPRIINTGNGSPDFQDIARRGVLSWER